MAKLSRGQIAGLAAAGALAALAGVAVYSSREGAPATAAARPEESTTTSVPETSSAPPAGESDAGTSSEGSVITASIDEIMLTPQARILAERLKCVCGCDDILATCSCAETPGSRDMKKYLQQLVDEGKAPAEVEAALVARYGEAVRP
jgi:cytochrome c-type biogenesis protein CcmH/NrfF